MRMLIEGRARLLGDDINTDYIITSTRKRETIDPHRLKAWLLETLDPGFAASVRPGDLLVAGRNFGCGSAMEIAATVVLAAGIRAVLAQSFARTFFRNAVNNGLIPVECNTHGIVEGDLLRVEIADETRVTLASNGLARLARPIPPFMRELLDAGGLVPYFAEYHDFRG